MDRVGVKVARVRRVVFVLIAVVTGSARADTPEAPGAPPDPPAPTSGFDIEFGGGAIVPSGSMADVNQAGLDVGARVGWSSKIGLGLVLSVDYAPLRQKAQPLDEAIDSHLFSGSLEPRFTLGRNFVRVWFAAGAGVLVERTQTQVISTGVSATTVDSGITLGGQGGLDFLLFDSGGLSLAGAYTRGISSADKFEYLAFTAGLLFTL